MFWLSEQLRNTGDPVDIERAQIIENMLDRRGVDIALPGSPETEVVGNAGNLALKYTDVCLLRDRGNDVLLSDVSQQVSRIERVTEIKAQAETVLSSYNNIFRARVPAYQSPVPRKRFGRSDNVDPTPRYHRAHWDYQFKRDGTPVDFAYGMDFWQSAAESKIQSVSVRINSQLDSTRTSVLTLGYKEGNIKDVELKWEQATPHTLLKLAGDSFLAEFINKFFVIGNWDGDVSAIKFHFGGSEPQLSINQDFTKSRYALLNDISTGSDFNLNAAADEFIRVFVNLDANHRAAEKTGVSLENSLSLVQFMKLLEEIMSLIPTISSEQLNI